LILSHRRTAPADREEVARHQCEQRNPTIRHLSKVNPM
jgi:hypothetical protein